MKKKTLSLSVVKKDFLKSSNQFMEEIKKELVTEEHTAFKDFIKAIYRLKMEKERQIEALQREITKMEDSLAKAEKGDWDLLNGLKIPARYFDEATLRKHGQSQLVGNEELRFIDLYSDEG